MAERRNISELPADDMPNWVPPIRGGQIVAEWVIEFVKAAAQRVDDALARLESEEARRG